MTFATFKNKGEQQYGEISFLTNLPVGSRDRLESLEEGYDTRSSLCCCPSVDQRQAHPFEDIFEDFDDGTLCAMCLRSERNSEALPVLPQRKSTPCCQAARKVIFRIPFGLSLHKGL